MDETFDEIYAIFSGFVEVLNATDNSSNKLILISPITDFLAFRDHLYSQSSNNTAESCSFHEAQQNLHPECFHWSISS